MPPPSTILLNDQKSTFFQSPKFGAVPKVNQTQPPLPRPLPNYMINKLGVPKQAAIPNLWEQPSKAGYSISFHSEPQKRKLDKNLMMTGLASNEDRVQSCKRNPLDFVSNNSNQNSALANSSKLSSFQTSSGKIDAPPLPLPTFQQHSFANFTYFSNRKGSNQNLQENYRSNGDNECE